jgi:hypothetical protein
MPGALCAESTRAAPEQATKADTKRCSKAAECADQLLLDEHRPPPDYKAWVHCSSTFDDFGFPIHEESASTVVEGLLRKRKSSLLIGVGEDAAIVAGKIAASR